MKITINLEVESMIKDFKFALDGPYMEDCEKFSSSLHCKSRNIQNINITVRKAITEIKSDLSPLTKNNRL